MERTQKPIIQINETSIYCSISIDSEVVGECKAVDAGDVILVDEIFVAPKYRNLGMGSAMIKAFQEIKPVVPCGIEDTEEAVAFWDKLDLYDGIHLPDYERYYKLLIEHNLFQNNVKESA